MNMANEELLLESLGEIQDSIQLNQDDELDEDDLVNLDTLICDTLTYLHVYLGELRAENAKRNKG